MLRSLQLKDFVIVDAIELELAAGLTALTGETGAGKSIVVDALMLIAGGRAGTEVVRHGAERAEIAAAFCALPAAARSWLEEQSIEHDDEVLIRRVVGSDGRSRAYINGQMVALQSLRTLADTLIEIHGQQEFQRLVDRGAQRDLIDAQLEDRALAGRVRTLYERHRELRAELDALRSAAASREARLELLRYQLGELDAEVGTTAAIEELLAEQKRIASRGRLAQAAAGALDALYEREESSAHDLLGRAAGTLRGAVELDPALGEAAGLVSQAAIQAREAADSLRRYLEALAMDPEHQESVERRAAGIESLARKHRVAPTELPAQAQRLREEFEALSHAERSLAELESELERVRDAYQREAQRLSEARQRVAVGFGERITELMQGLGMKGGRFLVSIERAAEAIGPHGGDTLEFLVSANPGVPPRSLARVASGGELSRISLAVQVAGAAEARVPCMVFDEVDAGIGGATAEIVGRQLRALAARSQVLCVTHLAQVAAQAHQQLKVAKRTVGRSVRTAVEPLGGAERIDELARMLGGLEVSSEARAHAREMLARAAADAPRAAPPARRRATSGASDSGS